MVGLVDLVPRACQRHRGHLVEGQLVVVGDLLGLPLLLRRELTQLLHVRVIRMGFHVAEQPPTARRDGQHLAVEQPRELTEPAQPARPLVHEVERGVEVAILPMLLVRPALVGGEHSALHGKVDALEPSAVAGTGGVPHEQRTVCVELGLREVAPGRQRLGAVADALSALEDLRDLRMSLEALHAVVRIRVRVLVVQSRHESERDVAVL